MPQLDGQGQARRLPCPKLLVIVQKHHEADDLSRLELANSDHESLCRVAATLTRLNSRAPMPHVRVTVESWITMPKLESL